MFRLALTALFFTALACQNPRDAEEPFNGEPLPDFALTDMNENSLSYGMELGPRNAEGSISIWYFTHANCPYCQSQFDILHLLKADLDDEYGEDSVQILGVNAVGYEDSISDITEGNTLPLLQDTEPVDAWGAWYADWRDLVIIDESNAWVGLFNLTTHDLADASNLTDVREMVDDALATQ